MPKTIIYGTFAQGLPKPPDQRADHILGLRLQYDTEGRPDWVDLQWQSADGEPISGFQIDYANALFLLSLLKSMQLDVGTPFPDDPRAPQS